jgi:hypothetical protein
MGLVIGLTGPFQSQTSVTPRSSLRDDRAVTVVIGIGFGLAFALLFGQAFTPLFAFVYGFLFSLVVSGMFSLAFAAWPKFALAKLILAVRGLLPWRLTLSLEDAHQRGVLRQTGAVYQFRHARLQEHLARSTSQP